MDNFSNEWTKEIELLRTENARLTKAFDSALKMRNEEHAENKELLEEVMRLKNTMQIAETKTGGSYIDLDVPNGGWVWSMDEGKFVESEDLIAKAGGK